MFKSSIDGPDFIDSWVAIHHVFPAGIYSKPKITSRRSVLVSYRRDQVHDQRVDFAQVFAAAFFWLQFAIANNNREIADLVQHFPRHLFDRSTGPKRGEADKQIVFETGDVGLGNDSQIAVQRMKLGFKHRYW